MEKVVDCVNVRSWKWRKQLTPHWPRFDARSRRQTTAWSLLVSCGNSDSCAKTRLSVKVCECVIYF